MCKEINEGFHHVMSCYDHYGCSAFPSVFVCLKNIFYVVWLSLFLGKPVTSVYLPEFIAAWVNILSAGNVAYWRWRKYCLLPETHPHEINYSLWWMLILSVSLLQHIILQLCYYQRKAAALRAEVQSSIFVTLTVSGNPLFTNSVY